MKKKYRIKKSEEIKEVLNNKQFIASKSVTLYTKNKKIEHARVAISVSKKIGKAHVRNKIKRQLRMMVQSVFTFDEPFDTVILVRGAYLELSYEDNLKNLQYLISKVRKKYVENIKKA